MSTDVATDTEITAAAAEEKKKKKYNRELLKASPAEFKNFSREDQRYWVFGHLAFKSNYLLFKRRPIPPDVDDDYVGVYVGGDEEEPEEDEEAAAALAESESSEESEEEEEEESESEEDSEEEESDEPKSKESKTHDGPKGLVYPGSQTTAF